jgi:hypothetical protein
MRRKNRKWVALAVALYLFIMWSAYRWAISQRPSDGNILSHIEREELREFKERQAREAEESAKLQPHLAEWRLNAEPSFVAARYDASRVVFMVATDTEARFSASPLSRSGGTPTRVAAPAHPAAPLAGLAELWEPDSQAPHFFPEIVQKTQPKDQWTLSLSATTTIPVIIERTVVAPSGCSLGIGFLASIPPDQRAAFAASGRDYFLVRRNAVEPADPPIAARIDELSDWKTPLALAQQIEQQLNERMKQEVASIDSRLFANAASPGATAGELPIGNARPRLREWIRADRGLARGEGTLDYDIHAYRLTPDEVPRLFVRARWKLNDTPVFLMTIWFKADWPKAQLQQIQSHSDDAPPVLLWSDASWSLAMRQGEAPATLGDSLDFQTILNEFDADSDGWAELLIHSYDLNSNELSGAGSHSGPSTTLAPYLYTDQGLVPLKQPLRRDLRTVDACLDP